MTDPTAKPQPPAPTTATAPPVPGEIEKLCAAGLAYWEARLVVKARQLRAGQKRAMLVLFDGSAMALWRAEAHVGGKCDMALSRIAFIGGRAELELWAFAPEGRVTE